MAVVVNFGSDMSYIVFDKNKVLRSVRLGSCDQELVSGEELKSILSGIVESNPELVYEPVYIILSAGCGVVYKTFTFAQESIMINGSRTTDAEKQASVLELIDSRKPFGLKGEYVSVILTEYKTDVDYVLSCAYFPKAVLDNIRQCFVEANFSLFDVYSLAYGIYKALDIQKFKQLIIDCGDEYMLVNPLGTLVWAKPDNFDEDAAKQFLVEQSKTIYGVDPDVADTMFVDRYRLSGYLLPGFSYEAGADSVGASAFGLLGNISHKKASKNPDVSDDKTGITREGGVKDVIAKLRFLFDAKGEK